MRSEPHFVSVCETPGPSPPRPHSRSRIGPVTFPPGTGGDHTATQSQEGSPLPAPGRLPVWSPPALDLLIVSLVRPPRDICGGRGRPARSAQASAGASGPCGIRSGLRVCVVSLALGEMTAN